MDQGVEVRIICIFFVPARFRTKGRKKLVILPIIESAGTDGCGDPITISVSVKSTIQCSMD